MSIGPRVHAPGWGWRSKCRTPLKCVFLQIGFAYSLSHMAQPCDIDLWVIKWRSAWPIFHGSVILPNILKTIWCMNMIVWDNGSVWPDVWSQNKRTCRSLWLHASSFIFDWIIIKVAGNQHRHKSSDEFDFGPLVSMAHVYVFWSERMSFGCGWLKDLFIFGRVFNTCLIGQVWCSCT